MLQPAIDIPQPLSADTETVITALETAELFLSKGDAREAVRWLRRAAESAGEAGDDERALALGRRAADLHEALELKRSPASAPRPSAPPAPVPRPSAPSASPPPVSVRNGAPPSSARHGRPPPLPTQSAPPLPAQSAPAAPRPSYPSPPSVRPPPTPSAPPVTPRPSYPSPPSSRPGFQASTSRPPPVQAAPAPAQAAPAPATAPGERHASRVAITRSPTQPGVFEMRLLADGEAPAPGGSEGFLVMLDPSSTLLSR